MGVFAMIAPFNFPGMVPFWFIPYALATGNTYWSSPPSRSCTMQISRRTSTPAGSEGGIQSDQWRPRRGRGLHGPPRRARRVRRRLDTDHPHRRRPAPGTTSASRPWVEPRTICGDARRQDDTWSATCTSGYGCAGQRAWPLGHRLRRRRRLQGRDRALIEASRKVIVANPHRPKARQLWVDADWRRSPFWTPR